VSKLDSSGNFVWAKRMGGTGHEDWGMGIAVDRAGNVHTTGTFEGTVDFDPGSGTYNLTSAGGTEIFVSKLDSSGDFVWAKRMGGTVWEWAFGIAVDRDGNVYTTGEFGGTVDFDPGPGTYNLERVDGGGDVFVSKLDSSGDFVWAKSMGGTDVDRGRAIAVDGAGNVHTTGTFKGTADFDPGPGTYNLMPAGDREIFVSKLDSSGDFVWARGMGGTGDEDVVGADGWGHGIAVDSAGNVYTGGDFDGTADFDPGPGTYNLTSAGYDDIFVSKLDGSPDTDGDGLFDEAETDTGVYVDFTDTGSDPNDPDSDDDQMPDGWEVDNYLDPNDSTGDNGADGDADGDGYTNLEEYEGGTDPQDENSWPPTAAFSASATSGNRPLTVDFTDESTDSIMSWEWDFGDGYTSTVQNPSHTYYFMGDYTVTLTVTGSEGHDSVSAVIQVDQALPAEGLTYKAVIDGVKVIYSQPTCFATYNELQESLLIVVWGDVPGALKVIAKEDAPALWGSRCDVVIEAPDTYIKKVIAKGIQDRMDMYVCGQVGYVRNFILKDGYVGGTLHYGEDFGLGSDAMDPSNKILIKRGAAAAAVLGVEYPAPSFMPASVEEALARLEMQIKLKSKPLYVVLDDEIDEDDVDDEDIKLAEVEFEEVEASVETKAAYVVDIDGIKVRYSLPGCEAYYNDDDGTLTVEVTDTGGDLLVKCGDEAYLVWDDYCDVYIDAPDLSINAMILKGNLDTELHVVGNVGYVNNFKLKYGCVGDTDYYDEDFGLGCTTLIPPSKILIKWGWTTAPVLGVSY
jgi:PKD repeat protein